MGTRSKSDWNDRCSVRGGSTSRLEKVTEAEATLMSPLSNRHARRSAKSFIRKAVRWVGKRVEHK